jgi:gluconokinase
LAQTKAGRHYAIRYSEDGGAEFDAASLLTATGRVIAETLRGSNDPVVAVTGSAFWHGLLGLDRERRPMTPVFTWADSRGHNDAAELRHAFTEREIQLRTGCMLRSPYWPAKLRWLRRTNRRLYDRVRFWTSPAAFIFGNLFGARSASHSMASGTGLYNLQCEAWDIDLCAACGVRAEELDAIDDCGSLKSSHRRLRGARVFAAIGDGAASNLGSGADRAGLVAINFGTSGAARMMARKDDLRRRELPAGLFQYVVDAERTLIGGATSNAGNLHSWCTRELRLGENTDDALDRSAAASDGLGILPFWVAERAPTWPEGLRGAIIGLRQTSTAADVLRAVTTSTFYRLADILDSLAKSRQQLRQIIVSGGILHSAASLRILADCLGRDIHVSQELEGSLRGAAIHALTQLGYNPKGLRTGKLIQHDRKLTAKHRTRRERQRQFELSLSSSTG